MARLWDFDEFGEPWLENGSRGNPPLVIVNNPKKGKFAMARRRKTTHRKSRSTKRAPARRRRTSRRRNPWPMAGTVAAMNRPRRRGRKRSNPRRRKHSYRRNPALLGISLPPLTSILYVGVGFVAPPMVEGFISKFLPVTILSSTIGKYAVRIASVLGVSYLTKMLIGSSEAKMVAIGGGAYVLTSAVAEFAPGMIPGLRAYTSATRSLDAYTNATSRTFNQLGAPAFGAQNTARSAPYGGANIVAARFRRFQ